MFTNRPYSSFPWMFHNRVRIKNYLLLVFRLMQVAQLPRHPLLHCMTKSVSLQRHVKQTETAVLLR